MSNVMNLWISLDNGCVLMSTMDGNKDDAFRCIDIATHSVAEGDREKAIRFLLKAEKFYPTTKAKRTNTLRVISTLYLSQKLIVNGFDSYRIIRGITE